jgi:ubiquitin C-terminal hydrolase
MVCTDSIKKYFISQVPAVLILHLKRFQMQKFSFRKVWKHVSFPILLDFAPVSKDFNKPKIYALYGVVEHSGNLCGGHYVAYVKVINLNRKNFINVQKMESIFFFSTYLVESTVETKRSSVVIFTFKRQLFK